MGSRLELQTLLEGVLGSNHVYFQPPPTISMVYPCIVYQKNNVSTRFADNGVYSYKKEYSITMIDKNPDSPIFEKLTVLPGCSFDRHYIADNLNHDVFTLYF